MPKLSFGGNRLASFSGNRPQATWRRPGTDLEPDLSDPGQPLPRTDESETVSDPYLSTPDELGDDNMRVRKLRSRLITLGSSWDVYNNQQTSISNFGAPPRTTSIRRVHTPE